MRPAFAALSLAGLAVLSSCSKTPAAPVDPNAPAYVEVQNQGFYDMTIYAHRAGMRVRIAFRRFQYRA